MWNPLISLAVTVAVSLLFGLLFGGVIYGIVPGLVAGVVAFILLVRRTYNQLTVYTQKVQTLLTPPKGFDPVKAQMTGKGWTPPFDKAIDELKAATALQKWQFLVVEQLAGQIGQLYYVQKKFDDAAPWLEKAWARDWMAKAFLGALHTRKKDLEKARQAFDVAVRFHDKEPLLWNSYAWCLASLGDDAGALLVLDRARSKVPSDERTATNLDLLRNGKKMNMKPFGENWYLFFLEEPPPTVIQQGYGPMQHQRGFRAKPAGKR